MFANKAFGLLVEAIPHATVAGGSVHPSQRGRVASVRVQRDLSAAFARLRNAWRRWLL